MKSCGPGVSGVAHLRHSFLFWSWDEACRYRRKVHSTPCIPNGGERRARERAREHCLFLFISVLCPDFSENNEDSGNGCRNDLHKRYLARLQGMRAGI